MMTKKTSDPGAERPMMDERVWRGLGYIAQFGGDITADSPNKEADIDAAIKWIRAMRRWYRA